MITEEEQEQAALYALGLLTADEAASFELALRADAELATLARELRETANHLVLGSPQVNPPPAVKERVLAALAAEGKTTAPVPANIIPLRPFGWVPWAMAAALAIFCGLLISQRSDLRRQLTAARSADPLARVAVYSLGPAGETKHGVVAVAWQPDRQSGRLDVNGLPAPGQGKDYQLWAVDTGRKDPINAGLVKVDAKGHAQIEFKPDATASHISAFAISLEPEGGSPKAVGPIVFVGTE